ncbi:BofC C-terminal domain-containing protein [Paenibacillus sp. N4]|uniref:BofC C-terminal domain-containing protein n=1 Tax=Paenibacillus vietnamensis TaxID=2590547 RepID=UPI001CD17CE3|nr:BofC C-terminal domain-containing protein [Paenibacillus vietnamensis]MCA0755256.1 BofC C-terminal domain-containing protein [Paenibacillus vietnamensis]
MMEFSLWKNIKKRIRRGRRPMWTLGGVLAILYASLLWPGAAGHLQAAEAPLPAAGSGLLEELKEADSPLTVMLRRIYVCGEEDKPLGIMTGKQVAGLLEQNPDWKAARGTDVDRVVLEQQIDDLSAYCKANAYIGVDKEGNLTLYDGVPKKEKVVRTFFQLDVNYMESNLPQDKLDQLAKGIRVSDIDEYNSVLSTYSDYAVEKNEKVMNPAY